MIKEKVFIIMTMMCSALFGFAQEICNNGIDDDGNGLVDCYDSQCNLDNSCASFFYGKPAVNCSATPTNPAFSLNTFWQSTVNVSARSTMIVGDMDGDGIPEVVCHGGGVNQLYILDGQTGVIKVAINCPAILDYADAIAIADTDDDGLGEIYVVTSDAFLRCFENSGVPKTGFTPVNIGSTAESLPSIADFNYDGIPEVYINNNIYNSLTGALIATGGAGSRGSNPGSNGAPAGLPIAADVLPDGYCLDCSGLELICGNTVYAVNIASGTITPVANSITGLLADGFTSIADMDLDGQLDVVVVSNGTIYVWNPRTGLQMGNTFNIPNTSAGGRANVADYDNDGLPEIGAGGNHRYVVIDFDIVTFNLSQKWINTIVDGSQHTTGSVFDFDCDGATEVVYRDENNLFVWDGATGNVKASIPCGSATRSEFPTIADVDGDGQVNIICACAPGNTGATGVVKVFNSSTNQWVGARKVMNQHSYFVTNINDDLSIPVQQQNNALLPKLNGFLAQSPIYDVNWNSTCIPLADMNIIIDTVIYCQKPDSVMIGITLCNIGSKVTALPLNISVYNGDPLLGGTLITVFSLVSTLLPGSCLNDTISIPFSGTSATFYIYVNDDGSVPANAPELTFNECDSLNNSDSVLINVPVLLLAITGDTTICFGDSTILTATGATSYTWSPASGLNTTFGNIIIAQPLVTTTYTLAGIDSVSGCDDTTIVTIVVNPLPLVDFTSTGVCNGSATQFTDNSTTTSGTIGSWVWDFGDSTPFNGTSNPMHTYSGGGIYNASLVVVDSAGCMDSITKAVNVFFNPVAGFTHADVCFGNTMNFNDTSSVTSPATITSYLWDFGDTSSTSNLTNPTHIYSYPGIYSVTLTVTTDSGCYSIATVPVIVYPLPVASFNVSDICLADSAVFYNTSLGSASFLWDFGDGSPLDSINYNPIHSYPAAGIYTVTLINYAPGYCTDTTTVLLEVFPMPIADFSFTNQCFNIPINFSDLSQGNISSWQWNFGDGSPGDTTQNPLHLYAIPGSYNVTLTVTTVNDCSHSEVKTVVVYPLPVALFNAGNVCFGSNTAFQNTSFIAPPDNVGNYQWNFDDGSPVDTTQNPVYLYSSPGIFNVELLITSTNGCLDSLTIPITVHPNPLVTFIANDTVGCSSLCVNFQDLSIITAGNNQIWLWDFGDGIKSNLSNPNHCFINNTIHFPIKYSVSLTVTSNEGCSTVYVNNDYITVNPLPVADFNCSPQPTTIENPIIYFQNQSSGANSWDWSFGDELPTALSNEQHPYYSYSDTGQYLITLIAENSYNCKDTLEKTILIGPDWVIYIPNAFTPNDDRVNDYFSAKGYGILEFEMLIFDRWGEMIFSSTNMDKGWDGIVNGRVSQQESYVYLIKIKDVHYKPHKYTGSVSVIR